MSEGLSIEERLNEVVEEQEKILEEINVCSVNDFCLVYLPTNTVRGGREL